MKVKLCPFFVPKFCQRRHPGLHFLPLRAMMIFSRLSCSVPRFRSSSALPQFLKTVAGYMSNKSKFSLSDQGIRDPKASHCFSCSRAKMAGPGATHGGVQLKIISVTGFFLLLSRCWLEEMELGVHQSVLPFHCFGPCHCIPGDQG